MPEPAHALAPQAPVPIALPGAAKAGTSGDDPKGDTYGVYDG